MFFTQNLWVERQQLIKPVILNVNIICLKNIIIFLLWVVINAGKIIFYFRHADNKSKAEYNAGHLQRITRI
ncbi:hypothetical protein CHE40_11640 [Salmonella enterica]|nr:hypothetical protein CHE40_11640 [Salmonella enterica]